MKDYTSTISRYRSAIMGFAALWIFFYHEWQFLFEGTTLYAFERNLKCLGYSGVDIFFLLSGFGLMYSMKKCTVAQFWYRRLKRVIIPLVLAAAMYSIFEHWSVLETLRCVLGIEFWGGEFFKFLWFMPAIITIYLIFPFYYKLLMNIKRKGLFVVSIIILVVFAGFLLKGSIRDSFYQFINRIPIFLIGTYLGWINQCNNREDTKFRLTICLMILLCAVGIILCYICISLKKEIIVPLSAFLWPTLCFGISLPYLLGKLLELLEKCGLDKLNRLLAFWGTISLEFYCLQEIIGRYLIPKLNVHNILINVIMITVVTLFARLVYIFEKKLFALLEKTEQNAYNKWYKAGRV